MDARLDNVIRIDKVKLHVTGDNSVAKVNLGWVTKGVKSGRLSEVRFCVHCTKSKNNTRWGD